MPADPLFPTSTGKPLTRKALARRIAKYAVRAVERCPSLTAKTITPHVLRHTAAIRLLHAGVDTTVIALWLGHEQVETTQMYLHADLALKERALARTTPLDKAAIAPQTRSSDSWMGCEYVVPASCGPAGRAARGSGTARCASGEYQVPDQPRRETCSAVDEVLDGEPP
jgi:hypothetical protein